MVEKVVVSSVMSWAKNEFSSATLVLYTINHKISINMYRQVAVAQQCMLGSYPSDPGSIPGW